MVQDNSVKQASLNHVIVEVYSVICDDFQLSLMAVSNEGKILL